MVKLFVLLSTLAIAVRAQVQSPTSLFNVTSPSPNAIYVASRILPCIYDISSEATADKLQLSIYLMGTNTSQQITASADISQGFSFKKDISDGVVAYEHQINYNIPTTTAAGSYQVVYVDNVSQTNVSIPITIRAAPTPSPSASVGSGTSAAGSSAQASPTSSGSIFKDINAAPSSLVVFSPATLSLALLASIILISVNF
ncbi:hypothetical protein BDF20DRAFT_883310 [Mycotypha africana]|uniref:uncharacterized protein n=1 Tax=Mycotypha africana TaxID=64632 RepID=UPI002301A6D5|nr:uncharacterized protein BDF20DRAFT_883310 [Mycotypha africana]KAI8973626.1 hypothetical protein BDF20DRAFT_883310 [Mycotypha africana]